ncbi:MAG TPA: DNA polymerase II, partial [bacterium]
VWYPSQWLGWGWWPKHADFGSPLAGHMRFIDRSSRRLARTLFHGAMRHQMRLAYRQQLLGRLVDIGSELFAMAAACARARALTQQHPADRSPVELADVFCRLARRRIGRIWQSAAANDDQRVYRLAQDVLQGRMAWLETGIL